MDLVVRCKQRFWIFSVLSLSLLHPISSCDLPTELQGATWDYEDTSRSLTGTATTTTNQISGSADGIFKYTASGIGLNTFQCVLKTTITSSEYVVVLKSTAGFFDGVSSTAYGYLCVKIIIASENLAYMYFMSDTGTFLSPNERATRAGSNPTGAACSTAMCQYTDSITDVRILRKQGTSESLPSGTSLCDCGDSCLSNSSACDLPIELQGATWDYEDTSRSLTGTATITTNQISGSADGIFKYTASSIGLNTFQCVLKTTITSSEYVVVLKSTAGFFDGISSTAYGFLCVKIIIASENLAYMYFLSDTGTFLSPNERATRAGSNPTGAACSTAMCQYTDSITDVRILRKQGTSESLPGSASLCDCGDSCLSNSSATRSYVSITSTVVIVAVVFLFRQILFMGG